MKKYELKKCSAEFAWKERKEIKKVEFQNSTFS